MGKQYDVVALGELLIDFTDNGKSQQGNPLMEANPGGAPCNVLALLQKLGKKTGFIGQVGNDLFGNMLEDAICKVGIDAKGLVKSNEYNTTLAFVHTLEDGDREFSFYRNPGADMMLSSQQVNVEMLEQAKIFHFGSLSMTDDVVREATKYALQLAKKAGAIISFDPNLREPLWSSLELAKEQISYGMSKCDILKISDNEILWFTGENTYEKAVNALQTQFPNIQLLLLSLGKEGSRAYVGDVFVEVSPFLQKNTIETTGAGDTFCGCVLNYVLDHGIQKFNKEELTEMLTFANAAAALITTKKGALAVMPEREEIEALLGK